MHIEIYKRTGSPSYQYAFTCRGYRIRRSARTASRQEAELIADAHYSKILQSPHQHDEWKLDNILAVYYSEHGLHCKRPDFIDQKISVLDRLLDRNLLLSEITTSRLAKFRAKRLGEGVSTTTVNGDLAMLSAAINYCVDVHAQIKPPIDWKRLKFKPKEGRIRYLSQEEYITLLDSADAHMRAAIIAAVTTGLRKAVMLGLQWHQIDMAGRTITIPRDKGGRAHSVRISPALLASLTAIRKPRGKVFDTVNFRRRWQRARKNARLVDFRWHDLRHTFGTWARGNGADLFTLQKAMDHSSLESTKRYAHVGPDDIETVFDRVGKQALAQSVTQKGIANDS